MTTTPNADDCPVPREPDWRTNIVEQRRQAREQELWGTPAISLAAQAFLFTTGLAIDTSPAARIVIAVVGVLTAVGTMLVVLRQGARAYIMHDWMQLRGARSIDSLQQDLANCRPVGTTRPWYERLPDWLVSSEPGLKLDTIVVWLALLIAFAAADVLVIASSINGWHLLKLGK